MPRIFQLEPHVADLIAAGEVVERPASVVKELVENSIDAGAGIVTVEIADGGMTFVRVSDNGCGITPEDAKTAFSRHATSKIRSAEGLECIGTLGFRGEALAAIAAVSRIELTTREAGAGEGIRLLLDGGTVKDISPVGCPEGTSIVVRDLFFNTPARLKFMKSNRAESSAVASAVLRSALSHPGVSVRFIKDGKSEYHTPGDSRADSCIYSLFGRDFSSGLIAAESSDESLSVTGFVSKPDAYRGNRGYQFFFVNGRPVQSRMMQAALEQAYANLIPSGRFPSCVLYVNIKPGDVDVNIHPAKTEVKFVSDKQVFDGIYYAALASISALRQADDNLSAGSEESGSATTSGGGFRSMSADEYRKSQRLPGAAAEFTHGKPMSGGEPGHHYINQTRTLREAGGSSDFQHGSSFAAPMPSGNFTPSPTDSFVSEHGVAYSPNIASDTGVPNPAFRVIGEALNTYIILESGCSLWLIDKHAAHERVHFNALKSDDYEPMSQTLIQPVICRFGVEDVSLLLDNAPLLDSLGFTVESFGEDTAAVRRIPSEVGFDDTEAVLSDICAHLRLGSYLDSERLDSIFRSIACGSSIKAGKPSSLQELESLAARVMSGEITHCPHGRPIAYEITKTTLEKQFRRS